MTSIPPSASDLDGADDAVPVFHCRVSATGAWVFMCTCGREHAHGVGEGHRAGHCNRHRVTGYNLLAPITEPSQAKPPMPAGAAQPIKD